MHEDPLLSHHLPSRPLPGGGQHQRIPGAGVGDQAGLPEPVPGDQVQPVGVHRRQHIAAVPRQDYQLLMPSVGVVPYLHPPQGWY